MLAARLLNASWPSCSKRLSARLTLEDSRSLGDSGVPLARPDDRARVSGRHTADAFPTPAGTPRAGGSHGGAGSASDDQVVRPVAHLPLHEGPQVRTHERDVQSWVHTVLGDENRAVQVLAAQSHLRRDEVDVAALKVNDAGGSDQNRVGNAVDLNLAADAKVEHKRVNRTELGTDHETQTAKTQGRSFLGPFIALGRWGSWRRGPLQETRETRFASRLPNPTAPDPAREAASPEVTAAPPAGWFALGWINAVPLDRRSEPPTSGSKGALDDHVCVEAATVCGAGLTSYRLPQP